MERTEHFTDKWYYNVGYADARYDQQHNCIRALVETGRQTTTQVSHEWDADYYEGYRDALNGLDRQR